MEHKTQEERMWMNKQQHLWSNTLQGTESSLPTIVSAARASLDKYYSNGLQTFFSKLQDKWRKPAKFLMGDYVLKMCQFYPFVLQNVHLHHPCQAPGSSGSTALLWAHPKLAPQTQQEKKLCPSRELKITLKPKDSTSNKTMILYIKHLDKT